MIILKDDYRTTVKTDKKYVVKKFKNLSKRENKKLIGKLEIGKNIKIDGLVTPVDYTFRSGKIDEVYYPFVEGMDFADYLNDAGNNLPLDVIVGYFEGVEKIVKEGHSQAEKIIFPDLLTGGNVLYNPETAMVNIVDFDGLQVGKYECEGVSDFIYTNNTSSLLRSPKYYSKGLYTENFDMFSIYVGLFYYTTKMNLPRDPDLRGNFADYLSAVGLSGTEVGKKMLKIFEQREDNPYLGDSLTYLRENYTLTDSKPGRPRQYIRK